MSGDRTREQQPHIHHTKPMPHRPGTGQTLMCQELCVPTKTNPVSRPAGVPCTLHDMKYEKEEGVGELLGTQYINRCCKMQEGKWRRCLQRGLKGRIFCAFATTLPGQSREETPLPPGPLLRGEL